MKMFNIFQKKKEHHPVVVSFVNGLRCRNCKTEFNTMNDVVIEQSTKSTSERTVVRCAKCNQYNFDSDVENMKNWLKIKQDIRAKR